MNIHGKLITLRAPEEADLAKLHQWSNDPEIWHMLGGWHFPYSTSSTSDWIASQRANSQQGRVFCIETQDEGIIGTSSITSIDWKNRNAFHGMMIGAKDLRGKGYALDALFTTMRYAFLELGLERLDGDMIEYNQRSIDFYIRKGGWKREGIRRNWFYRNGQFYDKVIVGVTKRDYLALEKTTQYWL